MAATAQPISKASLLIAILADPDNDTLRQQYANALSDANRRDFILRQLTVSSRNSDFRLPECRLAYNESDWLLRANYDKWRPSWPEPLNSQISYYKFDRGFVELVALPAAVFLGSANDIFNHAPIRHIDFLDAQNQCRGLAACRHIEKLHSISFRGNGLTDDDLIDFVQSPYLKQLLWLSLIDNPGITRRGVEKMAELTSRNFPQLRYVGLAGAGFNPVEEYAADGDSITWKSLPDAGRHLEDVFGRLRWLHIDATRTIDLPPGRFEMARAHRPANLVSNNLVTAY